MGGSLIALGTIEEELPLSLLVRLRLEGMEDLEEEWDQFSLTEDGNSVIEIGSVNLKKVVEKGERSLVCRLWSDRRMGKDVIRSTMVKIWKVGSSFHFQEINTNMFIIIFLKAIRINGE